MNKYINFYNYSFSTYLLIILLAFIFAFIVFYKLVKNKYSKIDIVYIFIINIFGFAIGSKIFSLIDNKQAITIINFLNSGYGFIGGVIGSIILIYVYSKKYKLDYITLQSYFIIIYPLVYSVSKIGCLLNGCCNGIIQSIPIQLIEAVLMFVEFCFLFWYGRKNNHCLSIVIFLISFGVIRFVIDYFRVTRHIIIFDFTLTQLICFIAITCGFIILYKLKYSKN